MAGRKKVRIHYVPTVVQNSVRTLFGTIKNAYERLGMQRRGVQYNAFYRALNNLPVTEHITTETQSAWSDWVSRFLVNPDDAGTGEFSL